jgi:hypothetical protein
MTVMSLLRISRCDCHVARGIPYVTSQEVSLMLLYVTSQEVPRHKRCLLCNIVRGVLYVTVCHVTACSIVRGVLYVPVCHVTACDFVKVSFMLLSVTSRRKRCPLCYYLGFAAVTVMSLHIICRYDCHVARDVPYVTVCHVVTSVPYVTL